MPVITDSFGKIKPRNTFTFFPTLAFSSFYLLLLINELIFLKLLSLTIISFFNVPSLNLSITVTYLANWDNFTFNFTSVTLKYQLFTRLFIDRVYCYFIPIVTFFVFLNAVIRLLLNHVMLIFMTNLDCTYENIICINLHVLLIFIHYRHTFSYKLLSSCYLNSFLTPSYFIWNSSILIMPN